MNLTLPWQYGEKRLRSFDFVTGMFEEAAADTFSPKEVGTGLAQERKILLEGNGPDGTVYRATMFNTFFHVARIAEPGFELPSEKAEAVVKAWADKYDIVRLALPEEQALLFPESVVFAFPLPYKTKPARLGIGYGFPLHPRVALLSLPKGAWDRDYLKKTGADLSTFSAGVGPSRRAFVPGNVSEGLKASLLEARLQNEVALSRINAYNALKQVESLS